MVQLPHIGHGAMGPLVLLPMEVSAACWQQLGFLNSLPPRIAVPARQSCLGFFHLHYALSLQLLNGHVWGTVPLHVVAMIAISTWRRWWMPWAYEGFMGSEPCVQAVLLFNLKLTVDSQAANFQEHKRRVLLRKASGQGAGHNTEYLYLHFTESSVRCLASSVHINNHRIIED